MAGVRAIGATKQQRHGLRHADGAQLSAITKLDHVARDRVMHWRRSQHEPR